MTRLNHADNAAFIERWYAAALQAVDPRDSVRRQLRMVDGRFEVAGQLVPFDGQLLVIAVGKAALGMARGVADICGARVTAGIAITKDGHVSPGSPEGFIVREAAHPILDERGVAATNEALELVTTAKAGDLLLTLISGGGSALLEAPRPPVTLDELAATTSLLLHAGAPIHDLNSVRVPLSLVKGGGLRRAASEAVVVTLILSDVLGNDPRVIASGPTVPTDFTAAGALAVLERYHLLDRVPTVIRSALEDSQREGERPMLPATPNDRVVIVGDNNVAVASVAESAVATHRVRTIWRERQGEAADLGRHWVEECATAASDVDVLVGGGEATVTVRGDGVGGRNTEFALAAAIALRERNLTGWTIASLTTDGDDGPTEVAGAIAEFSTVERAQAAGVDPRDALARNDSLRVFEAAGGLVVPGPTGTNVNDLYFAVRGGDAAAL